MLRDDTNINVINKQTDICNVIVRITEKSLLRDAPRNINKLK